MGSVQSRSENLPNTSVECYRYANPVGSHLITGSYTIPKAMPQPRRSATHLTTAASRARSQTRSCWFSGGRSGTGASFLRIFQLSLPILIPPTPPHSPSFIRGWYNRPNSERRTMWIQSQVIILRNLTFLCTELSPS
jgi:hypothetical protein